MFRTACSCTLCNRLLIFFFIALIFYLFHLTHRCIRWFVGGFSLSHSFHLCVPHFDVKLISREMCVILLYWFQTKMTYFFVRFCLKFYEKHLQVYVAIFFVFVVIVFQNCGDFFATTAGSRAPHQTNRGRCNASRSTSWCCCCHWRSVSRTCRIN